jgi:hypothetical protein
LLTLFLVFVEEYDRKASYQELIERLRRSNCRDILTNKNLLSDNDVVQLLRSYVNDSMLMNLKVANVQTTPHQNISKLFQPATQPLLLIAQPGQSQGSQVRASEKVVRPTVVQQVGAMQSSEAMEVSVDPGMFLVDEESIIIEDEDEETVSATEAKIETAKLIKLKEESDNEAAKKCSVQPESDKTRKHSKSDCSKRPQTITSDADPVVVDQLATATPTSSTKPSESAIEKPVVKKKKLREEKLKPRRKKIVIRINPSPSKRNLREKAKILPKFVCAICNKNLSSKRNLILHHETHKSGSKYKCDGDGCKKLFGKLENFLKHRVEAHPTARRKKNLNEK